MKIVKLPWLCHEEQRKKYEVYSLSVSADGSRLASGGLDGQVRIWSLDTISQFQWFAGPTSANTGKDTNKKGQPNSKNATASASPGVVSEVEMPDKSLCRPSCSMARHTGAVTTVEFSPSGRFLATGSDDRVVLIWEKDEEFSQRPKAFGETETELEHWTVRKRLVAHDNDVQDIAWAPDSSILVTVGLDRSIIIWNGFNFEKIKRFDIHNSHVKGVVFDPANKYFATASDDRSVLVFRYHKTTASNDMTFSIELSVTKPFKGSPLTSYFRRLSWSPDGQHIAVPNATNGPVTSVAIINRGDWSSDISLIGHSSPCEVTSFNPRLYELDQQEEKNKHNKLTRNKKPKLSSVVATAGQDRVLAIWDTASSRPLLVANDICLKTITDLAWSPDGRMLFVSSLDGTITTLFFETNELGNEIPLEEKDSYLFRYGGDRENNVFPESVEQLQLEEQARKIKTLVMENRMESLMQKETRPEVPEEVRTEDTILSGSQASSSLVDPAESKVAKPVTVLKLKKRVQQVVQITKDGKKRVAPTLMTSSAAPKTAKEFISPLAPNTSLSKELSQTKKDLLSSPYYQIPKTGVRSLVAGIREKKQENLEENDMDSSPLNLDNFHPSQNGNGNGTRAKKASSLNKKHKQIDYPEYLEEVVKQSIQNLVFTNYNEYSLRNRSTLVLLSENVKNWENFESKYSIHIQNNYEYDRDDKIDREFSTLPTRAVSTDKKSRKLFEVFLPHSIINGIGNEDLKLWILIGDQGSIFLLSFNGRLAYPRIDLGSNICVVKNYDKYLMVVTSNGLLYLWDIKRFKNLCDRVSLAPIINPIQVTVNAGSGDASTEKKDKPNMFSLPPRKLRFCDLNPHGVPIFILKGGNGYAWSCDLHSWVELTKTELLHLSEVVL